MRTESSSSPASNLRAIPGITIVRGASQASAVLKEIISGTHSSSEAPLGELAASRSKSSQTLIIADALTGAPQAQLDFLKDHVTKSQGVLILVGAAGLTSAADFAAFTGVNVAGRAPAAQVSVRVFPHFLTWGLPEKTSAHLVLYRLKDPPALKPNDTVFLEQQDTRSPIAYERVFEGGGRVIYLGIDPKLSADSALLKIVLANLNQFERPQDSEVSNALKHTELKLDRFRDDYLIESPSLVNRWLQLLDKRTGTSMYCHSALFLPLTPEFYKGKLTHFKAALAGGEAMAGALRRSLSIVEIRATDFCDEDCFFCYNRRSRPGDYVRQEIDPQCHQAVEDSLIAARAEGIRFGVRYTGAGEPLCHPRTLPSIYRFAAADIPATLISNGRALKPEDCERLGAGSAMIRFSINGGSPESYQKIHRVPGRIFPKLLDSIRRIHQSRVAHHRQEKLLMGVTFLVCPDNYTEIASFCRQIRDCGVDTIWLRACDNMAGLSKAQLEHVDQQLREANSLTQPGFTVFSKQFEVLRRHFSLHYRHENIPCWSAMTKAFIQPNSEVRVCLSRSDFVLGRVDQQHFFDIWSGPTHCDFVTQQKWNCFGPCAERRFNNSLNFIDQSAFTDLYRGIA